MIRAARLARAIPSRPRVVHARLGDPVEHIRPGGVHESWKRGRDERAGGGDGSACESGCENRVSSSESESRIKLRISGAHSPQYMELIRACFGRVSLGSRSRRKESGQHRRTGGRSGPSIPRLCARSAQPRHPSSTARLRCPVRWRLRAQLGGVPSRRSAVRLHQRHRFSVRRAPW